MLIDIILLILLTGAVIRGLRQGLLVGVFSFIALIVGLAAAVKLSAVVARHAGEVVTVSERWLPVLSFLVVFIVVVLAVRWGARLLQTAVEGVALGWVNKLGGVLFFAAIYVLVFSILLFYAERLHILQPAAMEKSVSYPFLRAFGPGAIEIVGALIPFFRDMFIQLQAFFER
ncbi:CvpA family protein [Terrimonas ferruginea]|uniref:CvpA family protein n=1 Tax=Terrimonas ferruginea TaxID=249 RepID=UPI0004110B8D|nr:CvpA family protein [Terrimonas ferruginea]